MATKALADHTKDELIQMVCHLKDCKKFGLMWEEKPEKVAKDCQEKLPILKEVENRFIILEQDQPTNIIIEGDNYHALSVLNYTHAGKIDVIYIDPPYNTGKKDEWKYNDNWVDENDAYRHSKWLSFMSKRLLLSKNLLSPDGVIFISIDDKEQARLKVLCDEIFDEKNFHGMITWVKKTKPVNMGSAKFSLQSNIEYILVYGKKPQDKHNYNLPKLEAKAYDNVDEQGKKYRIESVDQRKNLGSMARPSMVYEVLGCKPKENYRWQMSPKERDDLLAKNRLFVKRNKLYIKIYEEDEVSSTSLEPFWSHRSDTGTAESAKEHLEQILGQDDIFSTVKPTDLIKQILLFSTQKNSVILDFFAGSGTTGEAVLELNKLDDGCRQFILCTNNENRIAEDVTYPRIKTVITGVRPDGSKYSDGIPANVRYFKTDFVSKNKTNDKLRREIAPLCTDMIRIRENCFESVIDTEKLKVVKNARGLTALIFDDGDLIPYITEIEKLDTEAPVFLYVFSYNNDNRDYEIPENTRHKYKSQPIPEGVLAVYRRIFQPKGN
ncbi:MAG: site-specific DNA-methyltransferase [Alphaproteobacteria bacterium]|nr:site-specific DNA-methyltransferase [Alphaproteobacteria bacterium]